MAGGDTVAMSATGSAAAVPSNREARETGLRKVVIVNETLRRAMLRPPNCCAPRCGSPYLVHERQSFGNVRQSGPSSVALRNNDLGWTQGPCDADVRVVVGDSPFDVRRVVPSLLVEDIGRLTQNREAMSKTDRHVKRVHILVGQIEALPPSVGRRTSAEIDDSVPDVTSPAPHELCAPVSDLKMQTPHDPKARSGVVVLNPLVANPRFGECTCAKGLAEEAALVGENPRNDQPRARNLCLTYIH